MTAFKQRFEKEVPMSFRAVFARCRGATLLVGFSAFVAWLLLPDASLHAQALGSSSTLSPELEMVRAALDKYQDPIVASMTVTSRRSDVSSFPPPEDPARFRTPRGGWASTFSTLL